MNVDAQGTAVTGMVQQAWLLIPLGILFAGLLILLILFFRQTRRAAREAEKNREVLEQRIQEQAEQTRMLGEQTKENIQSVLSSVDDSMKSFMGRMEMVQQSQSDEFGGQLRAVRKRLDERIDRIHASSIEQIERMGEENREELARIGESNRTQMQQMSEENRVQIEELKASIEEKMEDAVDRRLTDSFSQVSGRLEQVSQSLGALQDLAGSMDEFSRMIGGKTPLGLYGEAQLGNLLAEMLAPQQYAQHARVRPDRDVTADYVVVMPGQSEGRTVYLPIDASLPTREYEELHSALERGNREDIDSAREMLESSVRTHARRVSEQIIAPPYTTDYGILFLQTEGLYAELLRINGLADRIQRESHIVLAGPATLAALLSGLQVGFRSLAIEQRTDEVISLLSAVRTDFIRYAGALDRTQKRLHQASEEIEQAQRQGQMIARRLSDVSELPEKEAQRILGTQDTYMDEPDGAWD